MNNLAKFLKDGTIAQDAAEEEVIVPAPVGETAVIAVAEPQEDMMQTLLAKLIAIGWLAKDLHYRAKDRSFYGNHLLADIIYDVTTKSDNLNEVYYLGEKMSPPPLACETAEKALKMMFGLVQSHDSDEMAVARRLLLFLEAAIHEIERIKDAHKYLKSGTVAVLDGISEDLLKDSGLLRRVVAPESAPDSAPSEGEVVVAVAKPDPITAYLDMEETDGENE